MSGIVRAILSMTGIVIMSDKDNYEEDRKDNYVCKNKCGYECNSNGN